MISRALMLCVLGLPSAGFAQGLDPIASEEEPVVTVDATYVGDFWRNSTGGLRTGSAYLGNADIAVALDASRALGLDGTTFYMDVQSIHGQGVSSRLIGDAQVVSNIEADSQLRLYELWVERSFGRRAATSMRFGLYDMNSEFDSLESAGLFLNASHGVGPQIAQTGLNGPSIFPSTSLGARFNWGFAKDWNARVAILDGVPGDPNDPSRNRIRFGARDGVLALTEVARSGARLHKIAVGAWTYTARFEGIEEPAKRSKGNRGYYAIAEGQLFSEQDDSAQGLTAFVRAGTAQARINRFDDFMGAGFVYTGALPSRAADQLGIAIASAGNGAPYRRAQLLDGAETDSRETTVEVSYRFGVTEWLTLQTSLQHVSNPDTNPELRDAFAFALRFELSKGWGWPPPSRARR